MVQIFGSAHYYLTVLLCVMGCYIVDLYIEAWRFEIKTNPTSYLRKIISYRKKIDSDPKIMEEFENIYKLVKIEGIEEDFKREEYLEEKRDQRMNKYGARSDGKGLAYKTDVIVKREPRNEIELEFLE